MTWTNFFQIDLPALLLGTLACLVCGLLGNFLILRRQALLGDAISHVVLPGIVLSFLVVGTLAPQAMFLGALGASLLAVGLIAIIRNMGRVEAGAAMGTVFTVMFAAGVLMLELTHARRVHLDVEHTLYGALEGNFWFGPERFSDLLKPEVWASLPQPIMTLAVVTLPVIVLIVLFFKELRLTSFDPLMARTLGFRPMAVEVLFLAAVAAAAVAAFQAVGSILVIAMFICPAATARMLTDRLDVQIWLSALVAILCACTGYALAVGVPPLLGREDAVSAAGMIAVVAGAAQTLAMLFAPRHGALVKGWRQRRSLRADRSDLPQVTKP